MSNEQLLPCPFCGGEVGFYYEGSHDWVFDCNHCKLSANFYIPHIGDEEAAVRKAWNTRANTKQHLEEKQ